MSRKESRDRDDDDHSRGKKKRGSRVNKGLRHFSIKVCEKLSQTGETTYNEIAELLVAESRPAPAEMAEMKGYDEKNIRRRIYDALNVLMALDIIQKDKKKIRWQGIKFAESSAESSTSESAAYETQNVAPTLKNHKAETLERIHKKQKLLEEMTYEFIASKTLIERNGKPEALLHHKDKLHRPFIIINTAPVTEVTCEMSEGDRTNVHFTYSDSFSIHDNHVILKEIGMQTSPDLVPTELRPFLPSRFPQQAGLEHPSPRYSSKDERSTPEEEDQLPTLGTPIRQPTTSRYSSEWANKDTGSPIPYKSSSSVSSSSYPASPIQFHPSNSSSGPASSSATLSSYLPTGSNSLTSPSKPWNGDQEGRR
eukprot:gb/GEZN01007505.1/.p1 GENE.gb/GEZN01007505.1/~~gb/GEZN01007505.1/.p1  ORF type:complete len:367 (-),score=73.67 gb/GEZN01007505.1/:311-1411(-)